jgi:hypothetical protein
MHFRPGDHVIMGYAMANLSDLHKDELEKMAACNGVTVQQVMHMLAVWIDGYGCKYTVDEHGRILAIYSEASDTEDPDLRRVWFFVTKWFMEDFGRNFRAFRNHCRTRIEAEPAHRWTTVSFTMNPRAEKWARALGFNSIAQDGLGLRFTLTR